MNLLYDFEGADLMLFKGDDSAIHCTRATLTAEGENFLKVSKHQIKRHYDKVGEFAGFFLTDIGLFPDLIRRASKLVGTLYRDNEHLTEAKRNALDIISVIKGQHHLNVGSLVMAYYYQHTGLTQQQGVTVFNFLRDCADIKFTDLNEVRLHVATA
jgi:hypothetical protein